MRKYIFLINSPWLPRIARSDGAAFVKYEQFGMVADPLLGGRADARAGTRLVIIAATGRGTERHRDCHEDNNR
jgi:3-hydroxyisobutyrate dehydrogenase-like beta-hydroxyacid dehydrogenase